MIDIRVPPLGDSVTEATVARWAKNEGDPVTAGETLVELETDKINVEVPAERDGVLRSRAKAIGDRVGVGDVLGSFDDSARADDKPTPRTSDAAITPPSRAAAPAVTPTSSLPAPSRPSGPRAAPSAVRLAGEQGLSLAGIKGTGRGGVISKPDVIEQQSRAVSPEPRAAATPTAPGITAQGSGLASRETREAMSTRRKRIAENLLQSHLSTAHLTTFNEIDMGAVMAIRERHKERVEKQHGLKLSFMPFFARASVLALEAFPTVNAQIDGDTIVYKHYVNLGIAVASEQGLVVPNVKDAHAKSFVQIGHDIAALAKKARDVKLTMDDLTGGTFTITNGGVFGSLISTPIINYPQVAILGLHKIQERPVVVNGEIVIRSMMYVAMSYDHRIIDGQQAVLFLVRIKELMEDPGAMLIG
ncbi:MAG TPA: 2-oxoglutarate dehydrogenase complex dihydrolipoyllysine-residue succinyltransferase [Gemmatimonadaceae bacterium]|nr:2-oxoglutarate dehydrogenase complex dihydrolipoyllysine-residue succinyltransferase [Gemmatimonadaceae bacterium]